MLACADIVTATVFCGSLGWSGIPSRDAVWMLTSLLVWPVTAKLHGLYDRDHQALRHVTADEVPQLFLWVTTSGALTTLLALVYRESVTASDALLAAAIALVVAGPSRALARALWRRIVPAARVLIVGDGSLAAAARRKIDLFGDIHAVVVGGLSLGAAEAAVRRGGRLSEERVDRLILAGSILSDSLISDLHSFCRARGIRLTVVPPAHGRFGSVARLTHLAELPAVEYNTWDISESTLLLKRSFDVVGASVALALLLPLLLVVAVAICLYDRGPVLFRQRRAGLRGVPFTMWKFRTMVVDAEQRLPDLVRFDELEEPVFKLRGDPRVTPVGRLLRRFSLDELPQLLNVLRGDMSLVGPRPEQVELVERYTSEQALRLRVKPGLTGPMQVYGRGDLSFEERLAVEQDYLENLSLGRDLWILAHTFGPVFTGRGAY